MRRLCVGLVLVATTAMAQAPPPPRVVARWDRVGTATQYDVLECRGSCASYRTAATATCQTAACAQQFSTMAPVPELAIGASVVVSASVYANIRSGVPSWTLLGTQPRGSTGVIIGGPATKADSGSIYWQVDFATGVDGWVSAGGYIQATAANPYAFYVVAAVHPDGSRVFLNRIRANLLTPGAYRAPRTPMGVLLGAP